LSANRRIDFELLDADDLDNMTAWSWGEYYVKGKLRDRMNKSRAFVLLVGEPRSICTSTLVEEIDLAVELKQPIIVVNLNNKAASTARPLPRKNPHCVRCTHPVPSFGDTARL
jgi:antiphage defense system Thoeris ThsB-like protein